MAGKAVVCFVGLYGNPARAVDEIRRFLLTDRHGRTRGFAGRRRRVGPQQIGVRLRAEKLSQSDWV